MAMRGPVTTSVSHTIEMAVISNVSCRSRPKNRHRRNASRSDPGEDAHGSLEAGPGHRDLARVVAGAALLAVRRVGVAVDPHEAESRHEGEERALEPQLKRRVGRGAGGAGEEGDPEEDGEGRRRAHDEGR